MKSKLVEKIESVCEMWKEVRPYMIELEERDFRRNHIDSASNTKEVYERMDVCVDALIDALKENNETR